MTPLEPDFAKHLMNVLTDLAKGQNDGVEESFEAIMTHPGISDRLVPIMNWRDGEKP